MIKDPILRSIYFFTSCFSVVVDYLKCISMPPPLPGCQC